MKTASYTLNEIVPGMHLPIVVHGHVCVFTCLWAGCACGFRPCERQDLVHLSVCVNTGPSCLL